MKSRRLLVGLVAIAVATLPLAPARGDWPVGRHDPQRTAAADGTSNISSPETRWRYYLGGSLSTTAALAVDVDVDGVEEYVMAAGGALVARRLDDTVVWRVAPRDIQSVLGLSDLDGDGDQEIVTGAARGVFIVDAATGVIEWQTPVDLMGLIGGVRIADLDGDQLDDVLIVQCGSCCAVQSSTWPGAAYGFSSGVAQPVELWQLPQSTCGQNNSLTVIDADGDAALEVLVGTSDFYQLLDGSTGVELARTGDLGTTMQAASCIGRDVDAAPGEEIVCVNNNAGHPDERSVFVLHWDGATLGLAWRVFLANQPTDELRIADLVVDLGDGPRVAVSTRGGASLPWTTHVVDAATGDTIADLAGELVMGEAPRTAGGRYLITSDDVGLHGWREIGGSLELAWQRDEGETPIMVTDHQLAKRSSISHRAAILPANGQLLVVPRASVNTLRALALDDVGVTVASELFLALNVRITAGFVFPQSPRRPFAMARSDGYLTPMNEQLIAQLGNDDVQLFGIRTGGYYALGSFRQLAGPPRTADIDDDGFDEILVSDARGALIRLDPEHGSLTVAPRPRWVVGEHTAPAVTTGPDGTFAIACIYRNATESQVPTYEVTLRAPSATPLWTAPLPGIPMSDVVPAMLDGDGVTDLIIQWGTNDLLLHTRALSGVDGSMIWEDVIDPGWGPQPAGVATGRWDGEAADAIVHVGASRVFALSGVSGAAFLQSAELGYHYFLPILADVDDDPAAEVILTGGYWPINLLDDDLATLWVSADADQRPFPYGSLARCPDGSAVLVSQSWQYPARLTMTTMSAAGRGTARTLWLASGNAFESQYVLDQAGVWAGQLASSTVHSNLSGLGRPSALVGSSDGYLYLVDPCTGAFDSAVRFDGAVGEAVYGDTDGDGLDEILVTAGDGELHVLQQHTIAAPGDVYDLDVDLGGSADVDQIGTGTPLSARWDEVPGAIGYQAALIDGRGLYATAPPWRSIAGTAITFDDVVTTAGEFYRVAVRAVRPEGNSVDAASDGVTTRQLDPEPAPDGGCCDSGAGGGGSALLLMLLCWIIGVRCRRHP